MIILFIFVIIYTLIVLFPIKTRENLSEGTATTVSLVADPNLARAALNKGLKIKMKRDLKKKTFKKGSIKGMGIMAKKMAGKAAAKGATFLAKGLTKLSTGPIGAALLVFDILSMALDIWDPAGYGNTLDNKQLANLSKEYSKFSRNSYNDAQNKGGDDAPPKDLTYDMYINRNEADVLEIIDDFDNLDEDGLPTTKIANLNDEKKFTEFQDEFFKKNGIILQTEEEIIEDDKKFEENSEEEVKKALPNIFDKSKISFDINKTVRELAVRTNMTELQIKMATGIFVLFLFLIIIL